MDSIRDLVIKLCPGNLKHDLFVLILPWDLIFFNLHLKYSIKFFKIQRVVVECSKFIFPLPKVYNFKNFKFCTSHTIAFTLGLIYFIAIAAVEGPASGKKFVELNPTIFAHFLKSAKV